jgi:16S rRNA (uracil1498-N3)-methyltransferase
VDRFGAARVSGRRVALGGLAPGERRVEGDTAHYLVRVLRLRRGDRFVAFDPASGEEADADVVHEDGGPYVVVRLGPPRAGGGRAPRAIAWIQALPKGDKCDAIVRDATELGATRFVVVASRRSVVRLDEARSRTRAERWTRIAQEAARQCGRSDAPAVALAASWGAALADVPSDHARFCLWEGAAVPIAPELLGAIERGAPLGFACGPEGGLEEAEAAAATSLGWRAVSLGARRLRTETVAAAVLGAVAVWEGLRGC